MEENTNTNVNTNPATEGGENAQQQNNQATNQQQGQTHNQQAPDPNLRTFTQEQLDAIIARERSKAIKGMFTAEQMAAKDTTIQTLTGERDTANTEKANLQQQLEELQHEKYLAGKGVASDMLEFYAFKIGKLVGEGKTFEQAADDFIKDNPPAGTVRMSTGGGVSGVNSGKPQTANERMNALIRGAR